MVIEVKAIISNLNEVDCRTQNNIVHWAKQRFSILICETKFFTFRQLLISRTAKEAESDFQQMMIVNSCIPGKQNACLYYTQSCSWGPNAWKITPCTLKNLLQHVAKYIWMRRLALYKLELVLHCTVHGTELNWMSIGRMLVYIHSQHKDWEMWELLNFWSQLTCED